MSSKTSKIIWIAALSVVLILLIVAIASSTTKSTGEKGMEELSIVDELSITDYVEGVSKEGFTLSAQPQ